MRAPNDRLLSLLGTLALLPSVVNAITLSHFQPIVGFSAACTNAYNTPLTACSSTDFADGQICSINCIRFLDRLSTKIITHCADTKAYPETLIGRFFLSAGTIALCPNALDLTESDVTSSNGRYGSIPTSASPTSPGESRASLPGSINSTPTLEAATRSALFPSEPPLPTATRLQDTEPIFISSIPSTFLSSTTTSSTSSKPTPTVPISELTAIPSVLPPITSATSSTKSHATGKSTQGDEGGGGATPFDIGSSGSIRQPISWILLSSVGLATIYCWS